MLQLQAIRQNPELIKERLAVKYFNDGSVVDVIVRLAELTASRGMLLAEIDGAPATSHLAAPLFVEAGFSMSAMGLQRRPVPGRSANREPEHEPSTENTEG